MTNISVVVGGQYGSEAKGHVTARVTRDALAQDPGWGVAVVRVAGPNAGHTAHDNQGRSYAFRQVPVGVVVGDETSDIVGVIAAGSELDIPVVISEIELMVERGIPVRLMIDPEATIISETDKATENMPMFDGGGQIAPGTDLVGRIGSTGKGIGAARAGRLMREPGRRLADHPAAMAQLAALGGVRIVDTAMYLRAVQPSAIIIEGTQGYGLGLHAGHYPQTTSSNCRAIDFLAMAGINPWEPWVDDFEIWVVARVYPIRVAGNSGPLKDETTWEALGLPEERTTVTKKIRRVGGEDWDLVADAVVANGTSQVMLAVTMVDQKFPSMKDQDQFSSEHAADWDKTEAWLEEIEAVTGARVGMITTGPNSGRWFPSAMRG